MNSDNKLRGSPLSRPGIISGSLPLGAPPLGGLGGGYTPMQLVTPRVVAIAVRMLMTSWMTNLMVSFFMFLKGFEKLIKSERWSLMLSEMVSDKP